MRKYKAVSNKSSSIENKDFIVVYTPSRQHMMCVFRPFALNLNAFWCTFRELDRMSSSKSRQSFHFSLFKLLSEESRVREREIFVRV